MNKNEMSKISPKQISPVLERATDGGTGYFGFTCYYKDGRFENIIYPYTPDNRKTVFREIEYIRKSYLANNLKTAQNETIDNQ